ncbi:MAG TPA: BON domain-containing protein [Longimicrobiales bacterium]|nr:BON domain-containing protein [Longimicrobiales bacterium]
MFDDQKPIPRLALRIGIAGAIGFGALATGMFATRKGRHLVKEAWQGRARTRLEDRVLDTVWDDPRLARRDIDVEEMGPGHIYLSGVVRSVGERRRAIRLAASVNGVEQIDDALEVQPRPPQKPPSLRPGAALDRVRTARSTQAVRRAADADRRRPGTRPDV